MNVDEQVTVSPVNAQRIARIGDRVCATFLDTFVIFPIFWLVIAAVGLANGVYKDGNADMTGGPALLAILLIGACWIGFFVLTEYFFAGSPGKRLMGIEVVSQHGGRITLSQAFMRNLLRAIDVVGFYLLGFVVAMRSKQRQRIGDSVGKTLVVEKPDPRTGIALFIWLASIIAANGAAFLFLQTAR